MTNHVSPHVDETPSRPTVDARCVGSALLAPQLMMGDGSFEPGQVVSRMEDDVCSKSGRRSRFLMRALTP